MLDADLAVLYGTSTKAFNQAIRRNAARFPHDFVFRLTGDELAGLPGQSRSLRSQIVTIKESQRGRHRKFLPYAFTEHGALMAANVLRSPRAVQMSVFVIRAFVRLREELGTNGAILKRLAEIDRTLLVHDVALRDLYAKLKPLPPPEPARREIGFYARLLPQRRPG
jgi:hypothetical protein